MLQATFVLALIGLCSAALQVEHSFDGSTFSPAGKLVGNVQLDSELTWDRPDFTDEEQELLEQAVDSDGLYFVRVQSGKGTLLTSVPAAHLRTPGRSEQVEVHATRDGSLEAFNYDIPIRAAATAGGADAAPSDTGRPKRLAVRVLMPKPAPMLAMPEAVGEFMDIPVDTGDVGGLGASAYDPNAKPRAPASVGGAGGPGARKGGPPPPDERTWLQKNWLFVLAGGMMVLNVIAKANAPPPGQGGPGAPPGGGPRRG